MTYAYRASPLHAARAVAGSLWCVAIATAALLTPHPVVLVGLLAVVLAAAAAARVLRQVARVTMWGGPIALLFAAINPIVSREGETVIARGGDVPVLGPLDITLEATVYGMGFGLRALVLVAAFALHSAAVDPDELLRVFRRLGFRSALSAALATRMIPLLARDGRRMADAQRCRPGPPASRLALVRAVSANAMDRAIDVAATLEVRGYGGRRPPAAQRPWSRHDIGFALSALLVIVVSVAAALAGWTGFDTFPRLDGPPASAALVALAATALAALAPFADRRGVG